MSTIPTVKTLAREGRYGEGLAIYAQNAPTTPEEMLWAAVCMHNLKRYLDAKDLLELAHARGCNGAAIEMASVLRFLGQVQAALSWLEKLSPGILTDDEQALERRERGLLEYVQGNYLCALSFVEEGWRIAARTGVPSTRSAVAQTLGFIHQTLGQHQHAVHYLERALEASNAARAARIRVTWAGCLLALGQLDAAERTLKDAVTDIGAVPSLFGVLTYTSGLLARHRNRPAEALAHFNAAIDYAFRQPEPETEFYAQLQAAATLLTLERTNQAHCRLLRAEALVHTSGPKGQALLEFRWGSLIAHCKPTLAVERLLHARAALSALGLERDVLVVDLHLSEARLSQQMEAAARQALESANDSRLRLACDSALGELIHLPCTVRYLVSLPCEDALRAMLEDWNSQPEVPPYWVELQTLGASELRVNGRRVGLELAGTIEVISFLLLHPHRTRDEVIDALYGSKGEQQALNYFHQVKLTLKRATEAIAICYDKVQKTYTVTFATPIFIWDASEFKRLACEADEAQIQRILDLASGIFLQGSDNEWVMTEREDIMWSAVKVGLTTLGRWSQRGEYKKCLQLAGRLRELEPLNPTLAEYVVVATLSLEGEIAAKHKLRDLEREFVREVGEVPHELQALRPRLGVPN